MGRTDRRVDCGRILVEKSVSCPLAGGGSMKSKLFAGLAAAVVVLGLAGTAGAQGSKRTSVAVMDFDYGTVNHWWGHYDIGKRMAAQVVASLVNHGTFPLIERKKLDTVLA